MTALEIALLVVVIFLLIVPPKYDPAIRIKEHQERRKLLTRLARDGYMLNEEGLTTCLICGAYCGQCSDSSRHGLTLDEYQRRFL